MWSPFKFCFEIQPLPLRHGLDPLQVSEYTMPLWDAALSDYGAKMAPIEGRLSQKLREHFGTHLLPSLGAAVAKHGDAAAAAMAQPHQVLQEFARYAELLKRPAVAESLTEERAQLNEHLKARRCRLTPPSG